LSEPVQDVARSTMQTIPSPTGAELLERSDQLSQLAEQFAAVRRDSCGRLVLVAGEAGVGKTALLRRFCEEQPPAVTILWGTCDALFTPRALGPLLDVAEATGGRLAELVQSGARPHEVASELLRELEHQAPVIAVLEDLHWADEATLDVLRLLGRRLETSPALVLASYRDDELEATHPLRIVIGELATSRAVERLRIEPLSAAGVAQLAKPAGVDADELYRTTTGNPFFVTEVLAAGEPGIPPTCRDAVLARTARLSPGARKLIEAVAIAPPEAEVWLLKALAPDAVGQLDECLASGTLTEVGAGVAFRHELARRAVEESLAPDRKLALHEQALASLAEPPAGAPDLARLAHHAEAAGDAEAVVRIAPAAAELATSLGAHREAAAQFARALRFGDRLSLERRGELLGLRASACFLTGQFEEALEAEAAALESHRRLGDRLKEGDSLRALSRLLRYVGRIEEAWEAGWAAVEVLESLPAGRELALAYCNLSYLYESREEAEGTLAWGTRALELAERLDEVEPLVYASINIAAIELLAGDPAGREKISRSLELAQGAGLEELAGRAYVNRFWWVPRDRSYAAAESQLDEALEYCTERGLELWRLYLLAYQARSELDRGRWDEAVELAGLVLRDPRATPVPTIWALSVLGLVRARRGDPDAWPPLEEAWALAEPTGELQRIEPPAAARAEAFWLKGDGEGVALASAAGLELAARRQALWVIGELASWRRRAGIDDELPNLGEGPYAAELAGDPALAARLWSELDSPYEAALALAESENDDDVRRGLAGLQRLGARPAAAIVARRLRERGVSGVPRGPRPATRQNPAGLTTRELEVLALVAAGLRNAEIAGQLYLAEKTVDHHVSAILRKLGVRTRGEAATAAMRLELLEDR
jgi:DNA-binding CsgD family transcriptional regulator/tetratricopeptide (TPR) repeat protein/DNA-binding phage protein